MTLWLCRSDTGNMAQGRVDLDASPCPAFMAGGLGGGNCSQYWLEDDGKPPMTTAAAKPPYRIPSMVEVAALPWNGLNAVGFFSGCGGSALGCRMAGYRVLYACDTDPKARASYLANWPDARIDSRGVRAVRPEDVFAVTGLKKGEIDLVEASPPCTSFSTAGKRHKGWGEVREHAGTVQRVDDLFFAFADVLEGLQPRAFFAENVSGLVKGTAKGYFLEILARLKGAGYRVEARLLDAQWLGVPQTRQRLIFVGVRNDLGRAPAFPKPLPYRYSVRDACPWVGTVEEQCGFDGHRFLPSDRPAGTVAAGRAVRTTDVEVQDGYATGAYCPSGPVRRKFTIAEVKRLCGFPDDFRLTGSYSDQWARLGNAVPPPMAAAVAASIRDRVLHAA
jgi:DNA (cytosine-5)-methyltransferase 1